MYVLIFLGMRTGIGTGNLVRPKTRTVPFVLNDIWSLVATHPGIVRYESRTAALQPRSHNSAARFYLLKSQYTYRHHHMYTVTFFLTFLLSVFPTVFFSWLFFPKLSAYNFMPLARGVLVLDIYWTDADNIYKSVKV
jgi:hypothetical protein